MVRVLYVGGFELPDKGAAAIRVVNNVKLLKSIGCEVQLIGVHKDGNTSIVSSEYNDIRYKTIHYPNNIKEWFYYLKSFVAFNEIGEIKPDVIVAYDFPGIALLKWKRYCRKNGIKIVGDVTEWYLPKGNFLMKLLRFADTTIRMRYSHKRLDGMITISRFLYDYYSKSVRILLPPLMDGEVKTESTNLPEKLTLVYAGTGGKNKDRLDYVMDAINQLNHPDLKFKIIGMKEEQYYGMFGTPFNDKWKCVEFKGRLSHNEAINEIQSSHFQIFVRPINQVTTAGFPSKLVESFSLGVPIITNKTSNISDYLKTEENGFLLETCSVEEIKNVLNRILNMKRSNIMKIRRNCMEDKSFDYRSYMGDMKEFLNKLVK